MRSDLRAEYAAIELILREVLPRWLRVAADPETESTGLLDTIRRRPVPAEVSAAAQRIVEGALREERQRRLAILGTDGTP